jgi:hypothetical protein
MHHTEIRGCTSRYLALALALTAIAMPGCDQGSDDDFDHARMIELEQGFGSEWTTGAEEGSTTADSAGSTSGGPGTSAETGGSDTGEVCSAVPHELNELVEGEDLLEVHGDESGSDTGSDTGGGGGGNNPPPNYPPGWLGRFELPTSTQCNFQNWKDTDGVAPETPGCHYAYEDASCNNQTNDVFGEACEDGDVLVETNPGPGQCHSHAIGPNGVGVGHPDRFSCSAYCQAVYGMWGRCVVAEDTCGNVDSAYCDCGC